MRDTLNPLKRASFLLRYTVHGHAPRGPLFAVLDSVLPQDNFGLCPGYYYAEYFPDVDT